MAARAHRFRAKLTFDDHAEVRRLRRDGTPLTEIAERLKISKSSVSAVVHFHAHAPDGVLRTHLPEAAHALLTEIAGADQIPVEDVAV